MATLSKENILTVVQTLPSKLLIILISFYRYFISPLFGNRCRFYPCCSSYAQQALQHYGLIRGCWLIIKRIARCHPWHQGGYDPLNYK